MYVGACIRKYVLRKKFSFHLTTCSWRTHARFLLSPIRACGNDIDPVSSLVIINMQMIDRFLLFLVGIEIPSAYGHDF